MKKMKCVLLMMGVLFCSMIFAQTPILWNKLGSGNEVSNSIVGNGGWTTGAVTYTAAKYGSGATFDATGEYTRFNFTVTTNSVSKGTVEFWFKPNFSMVNGMPSVGLGSVPFFINTNANTNSRIVFMVFHPSLGFEAIFGNQSIYQIPVKDTTTSWNPGDLVHIALVWDTGRFGSGKTMGIYVNGIMTASITNTLVMAGAVNFANIEVGNIINSHDRPVNGTMDNIKVYNYAKTNFSDRIYETGSATPTISLSEPNGVSDSADASFMVQYALDDVDNVVTASLYYDTDNSGFDGTLITSGLPETASGSYVWNTTAVPNGSYYIYAVVNDGVNPAVRVYSPGTVTVNHSGLLLWNKLGSGTEISNSMVGPNGYWSGTAIYESAQYGNGVNHKTSLNNNPIFKNVMSCTTSGTFTVEMWAKPKYAIPSGITRNFVFFWAGNSVDSTATVQFQAEIILSGQVNAASWNGSYKSLYRWNGLTMASNELHHYAFVYDKTKGAGQKIKFYYDGVFMPVSSTPADTSWSTTGFSNLIFEIGSYVDDGGTSGDSVEDNVKVYNYAKTNFSDRCSEDGLTLCNIAPTVSVSEPNGVSDNADTSFTVNYSVTDADDIVTASLYYDNDNSGFDGTLITSGLPETASGSYAWNTAAVPNGSYYVYAIVNDGVNPAVKVYSSGAVTVNHTAAVPGLTLWNKLGSGVEINGSMVGSNGTVNASVPEYITGMFGNAFKADQINENIRFPESVLNLTNFTVEFWFQPMYDYVGGSGITVNAQTPGLMHSVPFSTYYDDNNLFCLTIRDSGVIDFVSRSSGISQYLCVTNGIAWTKNTWHHFALVFNKHGIVGGSKTARIYFDGVKKAEGSILTPTRAGDMYLGIFAQTYVNPARMVYQPNYVAYGAFDNLKIYNMDKTNFSDRCSEDGLTSCPSTNTPVTLTAPTELKADGKKNKITLSWKSVNTAVKYKIYRKIQSGVTATPADYLAESSSASYQDKNVTADARYFYVITAVNGAGLESPASKEIWAVADNKDHKIILIGNKFDPECGEHVTVKFKAEKSCKVRFRVFSIDGKLVHETENLATEPGEHQREWAGVSNNLTKVTPGVYILQIVLDDQPGSYEKVIISRKKK